MSPPDAPTIHPLLADRAAGVLLHPTSLPSTDGAFGIGDLGPTARRFATGRRPRASADGRCFRSAPSAMETAPTALDRVSRSNRCSPRSRTSSRTATCPPPPPGSDARSPPATIGAERPGDGPDAGSARVSKRRSEDSRVDEAGWACMVPRTRILGSDSRTGSMTGVDMPRHRARLGRSNTEAERDPTYHAFLQFILDRQWDRLRRPCPRSETSGSSATCRSSAPRTAPTSSHGPISFDSTGTAIPPC